MPPPNLINASAALARGGRDSASEPCLWQHVAGAELARFRAMQNFHEDQAPDPAKVERNVIFARRRGIVGANVAIDAQARILRQRVMLGNRTAERLAAGNGSNAVVLEDVPAKGHAVGVPARVVSHPEIKNGLVRGAPRADHGCTLACVYAAPLH